LSSKEINPRVIFKDKLNGTGAICGDVMNRLQKEVNIMAKSKGHRMKETVVVGE
jgi:hypothetical protein